MKKRTIVCRCEDITKDDIIKAIDDGYIDIEELRKILRIGMGPCQGRVCIKLVMKILEKKMCRKISKVPFVKSRPPIVPVSLGTLASGEDEQ